jgi:hypothetical protein
MSVERLDFAEETFDAVTDRGARARRPARSSAR